MGLLRGLWDNQLRRDLVASPSSMITPIEKCTVNFSCGACQIPYVFLISGQPSLFPSILLFVWLASAPVRSPHLSKRETCPPTPSTYACMEFDRLRCGLMIQQQPYGLQPRRNAQRCLQRPASSRPIRDVQRTYLPRTRFNAAYYQSSRLQPNTTAQSG